MTTSQEIYRIKAETRQINARRSVDEKIQRIAHLRDLGVGLRAAKKSVLAQRREKSAH